MNLKINSVIKNGCVTVLMDGDVTSTEILIAISALSGNYARACRLCGVPDKDCLEALDAVLEISGGGVDDLRPRTEIDEAKARELYDQGLSDNKIGAILGVGRLVIARWRNEAGLAPNLPPRISGTRPEVTVEVPEGLRSAGPEEPDGVKLLNGDSGTTGHPDPKKEPGPPGPLRPSVTVLCSPVAVSFEWRGMSASLSAPTPELAAEAVRILDRIVAGLALAVPNSDTR